jgi:hypothetical protein
VPFVKIYLRAKSKMVSKLNSTNVSFPKISLIPDLLKLLALTDDGQTSALNMRKASKNATFESGSLIHGQKG